MILAAAVRSDHHRRHAAAGCGSMVPAMPTSNNGEHIMGLPLREAREVFERDYLIAQISRSPATSRAQRIRRHGALRPCIASSRRWGVGEASMKRADIRSGDGLRRTDPCTCLGIFISFHHLRRMAAVFPVGCTRTGLPKNRACL
jgi:hypothetical protein